jgi:hypothetical protein
MFVGMIQFQLCAETIAEAKRLWQESVLFELKEQKGWKDASFSISRATNIVHIFTLWETKSQARWLESTERCYSELGKLLALGAGKPTRVVYQLGADQITNQFGQAGEINFN